VTSATIGRLINETQRQRGMTSVVVTHDIPLARVVGDRVSLLHDSALRFVGTWDEVDASKDDVLTGFVAGREPAEEESVTHA
jgi:phospholipid/cholesterol/gamma-HCH transport system ATP-binding protein